MGWRGEQGVPVAGGRVRRAPNQALGYYAGYGLQTEGSGMGVAMAGRGQAAAGQSVSGVSIGGQSWHPTILYLFALVVAEMVVFGILVRLLK